MKDHVKRLLYVNSLTGFGKVSTQIALPVFALAQLEISLLPSVCLSSHTGYPDPVRFDSEDGLEGILDHWQKIGVHLDGVITGYLKSEHQVERLLELDVPFLVDPVMGDGGRLYKGFDERFVSSMRRLVARAQVILPNLTEAAYLLGREPLVGPVAVDQLQDLAAALLALGPDLVLLTGVPLESGAMGVLYASEEDFRVFETPAYPQHFVGTGDLLTALVASAYFRGLDLKEVIPQFLSFMDRALRATLALDRPLLEGVYYQPFLGDLLNVFKEEEVCQQED